MSASRAIVVGLCVLLAGRPTYGQILGRTFSRFVPFEAFSFLPSPVGWHDRWSGTRVVRVNRGK